jgi:hypothetical protein
MPKTTRQQTKAKTHKPETMQEREAKFWIFIGTNGTGKTTTMKKFLVANKRNLILPANSIDKAWSGFTKIKPTNSFELDPNDFRGKRQLRVWRLPKMNSFTGDRVLDLSSIKEDADLKGLFACITNISKPFVNGGLFIDDFKNWIYTKGSLPFTVRKLFNDRRHRMLDIFMASHSFQDVNGDLIQFNPKFVIFKTTLPPNETVQKKIANFQELLDTIARVNRIAQTKPHYSELFTPIGAEQSAGF